MLSSPVDFAIVAGVALLIFGPKKLPELGKALGESLGNFKRSLQEAQDQVKNAVKTDPASTVSSGPATGCCGGDAVVQAPEKQTHTSG